MHVEFRLVLKPRLLWKVARTVLKLFFLRLLLNIIIWAQKHGYVLDSIHVLGMMKLNKKKLGSGVPGEGAVWSVT